MIDSHLVEKSIRECRAMLPKLDEHVRDAYSHFDAFLPPTLLTCHCSRLVQIDFWGILLISGYFGREIAGRNVAKLPGNERFRSRAFQHISVCRQRKSIKKVVNCQSGANFEKISYSTPYLPSMQLNYQNVFKLLRTSKFPVRKFVHEL